MSDDEEELLSPAALWAAAAATPRRRNPLRPRSLRPPAADSHCSPQQTPSSAARSHSQQQQSPRWAFAPILQQSSPSRRRCPARQHAKGAEAKLTDSEERAAAALANELFPPSPTRSPIERHLQGWTRGGGKSEGEGEGRDVIVPDSQDEGSDSENEPVAGVLSDSERGQTLSERDHATFPTPEDALACRLEGMQLASPSVEKPRKSPSRARRTPSPASSPESTPPEARIGGKTPRTRRSPSRVSGRRSEEYIFPELHAASTKETDNALAAADLEELSHEPNGDARARAAPGGSWPDDVTEEDGVLIYNPTPKKAPVKLTPRKPATLGPHRPPGPGTSVSRPVSKPSIPSTAKRRDRGGASGVETPTATPGRSRLRIELDLTADSSDDDYEPSAGTATSEEEELQPLPRTKSAPRMPSCPSAPRLPAPPRTPTAKSKGARSDSAAATPERRLTPSERTTKPLELIRELDRAVFRRRWDGLRLLSKGSGPGLPEGIEVVWNARLRNTAGRASWKLHKKASTVDGESITTPTHIAKVELATKVTDTASKLRHTLAHELCHLAAWAIDGEMKPPHGHSFKQWAKRIMLVRPDIEVTTTHSYEIEYKYRWKCVSAVCGKIFGRHSASIDPDTHGCPCGARLVPIDKAGLPKPGHSIVTATGTIVATPKSERKKSKWVEFFQHEGVVVRQENPNVTQTEVFKLVAERWKVAKAAAADSCTPSTALSSSPPETESSDDTGTFRPLLTDGLPLQV
ncbi:hypothetical protein JCM8202_005792 [Rhodotorula sphaerocarpa]